ncbi:MAG: NUDIX hydrolase [Dongiaceae bacterium]
MEKYAHNMEIAMQTERVRSPRLGCAVLVEDGGRLLLGERAKEPFRGKWIVPGGGVRFLENFEQAATREIQEETGIEIELQGVIDVQEIVVPPDEHRVVVYCRATYKAGDLRPGSDLSAARFFTRDEVQALVAQSEVTPTVERVLRKMQWA